MGTFCAWSALLCHSKSHLRRACAVPWQVTYREFDFGHLDFTFAQKVRRAGEGRGSVGLYEPCMACQALKASLDTSDFQSCYGTRARIEVYRKKQGTVQGSINFCARALPPPCPLPLSRRLQAELKMYLLRLLKLQC